MNVVKPLLSFIIFFLSAVVLFFLLFSVSAIASFSIFRLSDTISSSEAATGSDHLIKFQISTSIPPSGKIVIVPEEGFFDVPPAFNYTDMDLATSSSIQGSFTERTLAVSPSANADGVSVVSGASSSITITLNSTQGIDSDSAVRIKMGTNASFGGGGDQQIENPTDIGSYRINIKTYDDSNNLLDRGTAMIAIVSPVGVSATQEVDETPPYRYNGAPAGMLPVGTQSVSLSLNTDEHAYCSYATVAGVPYSSSTNVISDELSIFHSIIITGLTPGQHDYYIRCQDFWGNTNTDDYLISFHVATPGSGIGEGGGAPGGGGAPFPPTEGLPSVTIKGWAFPLSKVFILKDGQNIKELQSSRQTDFSYTISDLEEGVYTFAVWAQDTEDRRSVTDSSTFLVKGETRTTLRVFLPPTISLSEDTLDAGDTLDVSGQSVPSAGIEVLIYPAREVEAEIPEEKIIELDAETDREGKWRLSFDTSGLEEDTYAIKARVSSSTVGVSEFGRVLYFGLGMPPVINYCERADLNKDGRVNLTDFSILLYHWQTSEPSSDINLDGIVNLTDFSIMMYCWTG